jgi:autophagy-related protein 17
MELTYPQEAQTDFDTSILSFDDDIRALRSALKSSPNVSRTEIEPSPIPEHLHTLETNAQEMAHLLESLVSHFDLCVNAIRHTEGGYAAVRKAANSQPPDAEHVSVSGVMATEDDSTIGEPVSEEERAEMLKVLEADAAQVEDVVMELREFLNEMEVKHEAILEYVASLSNTHKETTAAYQILDGVSARLPGYIIASQDFRARWEDTKLNIQDQLNELESIRFFYENYQSSYDGLILEVHRRKTAEEKVKSIMRKAMEQVEKVLEVDTKEREGFRLDVGDYLPVDLWPGVNAKPATWGWGPVGGKEGGDCHVDGLVPELGKGIIEAAARRDRDRQRGDR